MIEKLTYEVSEDVDLSTLVYTFGGAEPKASIRPGTMITTSTLDCFAGRIRSVDDLPSRALDVRYLNPQTGPFFVEGAQPGDTLAVHFVSIEPRYDWAVSTNVHFFGALTSTHLTATLQDPLPEMTWFYEIDTGAREVVYQARESDLSLRLPLDPMHGTVGVAPAGGEVRSALAPGDWGGNMDTPEMRAGTTCYLGVNVEGALFSFGDGHARQGEGETGGVAVEAAMDSVVIVDLIKGGSPTAWPRIESDDYLMTTGSSRPLEDAFRVAHTEMVRWVSELLGLSQMDAYQLVSQTALSPVANVVDTVYTAVCKVPKSIIRERAYDGMHATMRARAAN